MTSIIEHLRADLNLPMPSPADHHPNPAAQVVSLRGVIALLGRFPALAGLDLLVERSEILVVRGPNGAGKTTLLKVLAGLVSVTDGSATVLGVDLRRDRRTARRAVGLLGHQGFLYDDLTVAENVAFAVEAAGGDPGRVAPAMARLGLDGRLRDLRVGACSAGQRRRTSFAGLVARNPALWLLDEPHAGLDSDARNLLDDLVREAAAGGTTILLASHDEERAEALATRIVTVSGGHITADRRTHQPRPNEPHLPDPNLNDPRPNGADA